MENTKEHLTTPIAIIAAGFLIMIGIILSGGIGNNNNKKDGTLSEQVGIAKNDLLACIEKTDTETLGTSIQKSVESATKAVPQDQMGTPYSVVVGKNGFMAELKGNASAEQIKKIIDEVKSGTITEKYGGELPEITESDHIMGNKDAEIIIVEYSDYECPYCKALQPTIEKLVKESNGNIALVFRHWPIHQNSFLKVTAAECVAKIKGNEAFWEYTNLLYSLLKTQTETITEQL